MTKKDIYKRAVDELTTENFDPALWAMVWTKAGGDDNRAKARYVEARVKEIRAQHQRARKEARRAARTPLSQRIPWRLLGLFACASAIAVINTAVAKAHAYGEPVLAWGFYLVTIAGYTLGLMLFPGLPLLLTWGSRAGHRAAFVMLLMAGCFAGIGGVPVPDYDKVELTAGYVLCGMFVLLGWLICLVIVDRRERVASKASENNATRMRHRP